MESRFYLTATDKQAQTLFDSTLATVKLMEFIGDKTKYPKMDMTSKVVHPWKVLLRHGEDIGRISGTKTFRQIMSLLKK